MFVHLKKYHNSELVFDPSDSLIEEGLFDRQDWTNSKFGNIAGEEESLVMHRHLVAKSF